MLYIEVHNDGESNVTVVIPGEMPLVAHSTHPNYDAIIEKCKADDTEGLRDLFDASIAAAEKFSRLSERVTVANGIVYLDGDEVDDTLTQQIVRFINDGVDDWQPLVKFFENVQANPTEHSRTQLFDWLNRRPFTITEDGMIVGYKGVRMGEDGVYTSISTGRAIVDGEVVTGNIPNPIGSIIEMPRSEVAHDPSQACSTGLHVATRDYARGWASNGVTLEVHVNPRDVVSVPTDGGGDKVRVCRYKVVGISDQERTEALLRDEREEDEEEMCPCGFYYADECADGCADDEPDDDYWRDDYPF